MDKFLYLISEGLKNVWRHKMTTFTAVFSLFLSLYFVGLLATAGENTKSILQYLRSKYKIEVFFKQNIDLKVAKEVSDLILEIRGVRSSTVINKDDAVRIFKDQFGEDILGILGYNPLPVSAVVNLKRNSEEVLDATPIVNKIKKRYRLLEVGPASANQYYYPILFTIFSVLLYFVFIIIFYRKKLNNADFR